MKTSRQRLRKMACRSSSSSRVVWPSSRREPGHIQRPSKPRSYPSRGKAIPASCAVNVCLLQALQTLLPTSTSITHSALHKGIEGQTYDIAIQKLRGLPSSPYPSSSSNSRSSWLQLQLDKVQRVAKRQQTQDIFCTTHRTTYGGHRYGHSLPGPG